MTKKRRKPDREHLQRPQLPTDFPDRRVMDRTMQEIVAGLRGGADQDTPLAQAQALMYRAFEERDEQRRVLLAKEALAA